MRNAPDKNPFIGVSDLLSRAAPAKRNYHFLSYIIDIVLVAIVSYLVFLGGRSITENSDSYKQNYAKYEEEITYYQDMVIDSHLNEYLDRDSHTLFDDEDLSIKMAISQVIQSYANDNPASPEFTEDPMPKLKEIYTGSFYQDSFVGATFANDYVSRFYIEYVPLRNANEEFFNFNDKTPEEYVVAHYKTRASYYETLKFMYSTEEPALPYLRMDVAYKVYEFLIKSDNFDRSFYDEFVEFYTGMLNNAEDVLFNAKSYQEGRYQDYLAYRKNITRAIDTTLVISIILGYYIAVFLPMMIFKDGRSFGKIFLRLAVINTDKSEVEIWKHLLRSLLASVACIFLAFFLVLLPPFNGVSLVIYLPYLWEISLFDICIAVLVLASINGIFMLLTHEKRSATDFLFKTITVDVTSLDEPDYDERDEANL